jgi:signal transduction histidine kinase
VRLNRLALWLVWLVGGGLTAVHAARPAGFALHSPSSSAVFETVAACGSMLLSAMSYGRWRERRLLSDVVTCYAFTTLAAGNVLFALLPMVASPDTVQPGIRVSAFLCGALAALLFVVASALPERETSVRPHLGVVAIIVALAVGGLAAAGWVSPDTLPGLTGPPSTEASADAGDVGVAAVQAVSAIAFLFASLRFAARASVHRDTFYGWLAVTTALWSLSRVNYGITPAHEVNFLSIGDWLRLAAYLVAVVAVASELNGYWRRLAETAVLEERRRIARDMHDGLAQELAFIATQSRSLTTSRSAKRAEMVARSAERALDESRRAIAALTRPVDEPLDVALAQQAEELGGRMGVRVLLDVEAVGRVPADKREALLRIAREAITNAGRHGRPTKISVQLVNHDGISMRVSDDGRGFRPDDPKVYAGDRWGVAGMRERAEALGGRRSIKTRPYGGTRVEVWVP